MELESKVLDLGWLVHPVGAGDDTEACPGVVLIHDVWGLSEHTRDVASRLAHHGFSVLAIDLYHRLGEVRVENAAQWIQDLSDPDALADVEAAAHRLRKDPASRDRKVAVVGFCMGGMYALLSGCVARESSAIDAVVSFYGLLSHHAGLLAREGGLDPERKPHEPIEAASDLHCPLLAFFGDDDAFVRPDDVATLRTRLQVSGQRWDVISYAGVGHAFMNDTRPDAYDPEVAAVAWDRMLEFLREQLL